MVTPDDDDVPTPPSPFGDSFRLEENPYLSPSIQTVPVMKPEPARPLVDVVSNKSAVGSLREGSLTMENGHGCNGQFSNFVSGSYFQSAADLERSVGRSELATEKIGAAVQLAVEKIGAASALAIAQNTARLEAQLAECCCEMKELVRDDGQKTRALVESIQASNLAILLQDAKFEIAALKVAAEKK